MKVKVSELSGPALDWAVMTIEGYQFVLVEGFRPGEQQVELPEWFKIETSNGIGAYWMRESDRAVLDAFWPEHGDSFSNPASPSTDWSQGGPLIDKYDPEERRLPERDRYAEIWIRPFGVGGMGRGVGDTRLVAFCRALVNAKLGEEIEIPDELLTAA